MKTPRNKRLAAGGRRSQRPERAWRGCDALAADFAADAVGAGAVLVGIGAAELCIDFRVLLT